MKTPDPCDYCQQETRCRIETCKYWRRMYEHPQEFAKFVQEQEKERKLKETSHYMFHKVKTLLRALKCLYRSN